MHTLRTILVLNGKKIQHSGDSFKRQRTDNHFAKAKVDSWHPTKFMLITIFAPKIRCCSCCQARQNASQRKNLDLKIGSKGARRGKRLGANINSQFFNHGIVFVLESHKNGHKRQENKITLKNSRNNGVSRPTLSTDLSSCTTLTDSCLRQLRVFLAKRWTIANRWMMLKWLFLV